MRFVHFAHDESPKEEIQGMVGLVNEEERGLLAPGALPSQRSLRFSLERSVVVLRFAEKHIQLSLLGQELISEKSYILFNSFKFNPF